MLPWVQVKVSSLTATTRPKSGWICQTWSEDQAGLNAGKTRGIHEVCRGISYISHIWKVLIVWVICMKFFMQFWDSLTRVQRFGHNRLPGKVDSLLYIIIYLIPSKQCSMQPRILFTFFHCRKLRIHKKKPWVSTMPKPPHNKDIAQTFPRDDFRQTALDLSRKTRGKVASRRPLNQLISWITRKASQKVRSKLTSFAVMGSGLVPAADHGKMGLTPFSAESFNGVQGTSAGGPTRVDQMRLR